MMNLVLNNNDSVFTEKMAIEMALENQIKNQLQLIKDLKSIYKNDNHASLHKEVIKSSRNILKKLKE